MRRSTDFGSVVRGGVRVRGNETLVLHFRPDLTVTGLGADSARAPRVGFVVGKQVGNSVVRNRVSRRLRAQMASRLDRLPAGSGTVVRALPSAASADSELLGQGLDRALDKALDRGSRTAPPAPGRRR